MRTNISKPGSSAIVSLFLLFLLGFALSAHAATVTWGGGGIDNLASNPANWTGNVTPRDGDAVVFDGTSTKDCAWDTHAIPASLTLNQGYTGTVTLNSEFPVTIDVAVLGGKLITSADLWVGFDGAAFTPTAPSALIAVTVPPSRIDLFWTDNSFYETGFKIERKTGAGAYSQIGTVGADATAYSDVGLTAGTTYYYRIRANNSAGDSSYSNESNAATPTPPTAASNAATNVTGTSAVLNATINPKGSETTVHFDWGTTVSYGNSTPSRSAGSGTADAGMPESITGLSQGTTYHYRVSASNAGGTVYGGDMSFTTDCSVKFTAGPGNSITGNANQTVDYNGSATPVTAVHSTGYHFVNWTGDNGFATTTDNPLTVSNVTTNQNITANFAINSYTLNFTAGTNGSITGTTSQTVDYGGSATAVTADPATGYHFVNWTGDNGFAATTANPLTVSNVAANQNITANFAVNSYTLNFAAGANGSVTGTTSQTVDYNGSAIAVTAVPAEGYHLVNWTGDNGFVSSTANPLTVSNVTANQNITANFAINTYTLTFTAGTVGSISGNASQTVNHSGSATAVTAVPAAGYHFVNWTGDNGFTATTANPLTLSNVTASHAIGATFAVNTPSLSSDFFYDDLGRLTRVIQGTTGIIYDYDELGNLISTTSVTTTGGTPVLSSVNPNVLFVGSKMLVTISGQNLLTTDSVTANGGQVAVNIISVSDNKITADMTALSAGTETITVTTRSGSTATIDVTLSSSKLAISPGQLALAPGSSGTLTASIFPLLAAPLTINLNTSAPSIATIPQSVTIPVNGSASFTVNALQAGIATIDAGDPRAVVSVASPFIGEVGDKIFGSNVSVMIDAPSGTSTSATKPVSVTIDAPSAISSSTTKAVSVAIDAPSGSSSTVTNPVSVTIDAPTGTSSAVAGSVSVKIQ